MTAAIFGLIGVIIGGVLNGAVSLILDARRDSRALQAAARLLLVDVTAVQTAYEAALENDSWWVLPSRPLPIAQWDEWKELLASRIGRSAEWRKIAQAFMDVDYFNYRASGRSDHDPLHPLTRQTMEAALGRTKETIATLAPYVRGEHLWGPSLKRNLGLPPKSRPRAEQEVEGPESGTD